MDNIGGLIFFVKTESKPGAWVDYWVKKIGVFKEFSKEYFDYYIVLPINKCK
jgi:hypothetical protein